MPLHRAWEGERGFTLAEVLVAIVVMGILFAIATSSWFELAESRRVDSATNQVVADLRLAHTQATNRLVDSSFVVASPNSSTYQIGPAGDLETRTLPGGDQGTPLTKITAATTIVFKPNGEAQVTGASNITVAAVDGAPTHVIQVNTVTSRVKVVS